MSSSTLFKRHEKRYAAESSVVEIIFNSSYDVRVPGTGSENYTILHVKKNKQGIEYIYDPDSISTETGVPYRISWKIKPDA